MLGEKGFSLYQDEPYGKLLEDIYGNKEDKSVKEAPIVSAPAPVPAAPARVNVSSILGSDPFGNEIILSREQRERLLYLLGISGAGKSTMLVNLILQNIEQGYGVCVLDPHGSLIRGVIARVPVDRRKDIILLDVTKTKEYVFGLNLYECDDPTDILEAQRAMERVMHIWERLFHVDRDKPIIDTYTRKCAQTIIPNPGYTMAEIPRLFTDIPFRNNLLLNVKDQEVHDFWIDYDDDTKTDKMHNKGSILRKLDEFLVPIVRGIVGQSRSTVRMSDIINATPGKILLVRLDKDMRGITSLIGSIIVAAIRSAAFSRQFMDESERKHFFLYADEFNNFATRDFQDFIEETRKFFVFPICAHQSRSVLHLEIPELVALTLQGNLAVFPGVNDVDAKDMAGNYDYTPPEPEMEPWGEEAIKTPVRDVIGHLRTKGGHTNSVITQFIQKYQQMHQKHWQEVYQKYTASSYRLTFSDPLEESWRVLSLLNEVFYQANVNKNAMAPISFDVVKSVFVMEAVNVLVLGSEMLQGVLSEPDIHKLATSSEWGIIADKMRENLIDMYTRPLSLFENDVRVRFYPLRDFSGTGKSRIASDMYNDFHSSTFVSGSKKYPTSWFEGSAEFALNKHLEYCRTKDWINGLNWFQPDFKQLQLQWYMVDAQELKPDHYSKHYSYYSISFALVKGQELYKKQELDKVIEPIITAEIQNFKEALLSLREIMQILATPDNAIEEASGLFRPIFRPGQQLSSDEMKNRIANMLSNSSKKTQYKSYVRVGGAVQYCWNCGKKPAPFDEKCQGCQKDLKNEYMVSVPFVQENKNIDVDAIIAEIVKQNVEKGYLRLRSDVEKEIRERQQPPEKGAGVPATPTPQNKPAPAAGAVVPPTPRTKRK